MSELKTNPLGRKTDTISSTNAPGDAVNSTHDVETRSAIVKAGPVVGLNATWAGIAGRVGAAGNARRAPPAAAKLHMNERIKYTTVRTS